MKTLTQPGSILRVLAIVFECVLGLTANARANDSITVSFGPDPTEEVPVPIRMSWTTNYPDPYVVVTVKPGGGLGGGAMHRVSVTSELPRYVVVTRKPAVPGAACAAPYALEDPVSLALLAAPVQGMQGLTRVVNAPREPGTYLLCGYVLEANRNSAPEAIASTTFVVGPDACMMAKDALAVAAEAVKSADGPVRRYHREYTYYRERARHAHGERRQRLMGLAARHRIRYRSAIGLRDEAGAALASAQLDVTTACVGV